MRDLLHARYGADGAPETTLGEVSPTLELLLKHRTVRKFTDAPVGDDEITAIIAAAQSAPSSSNHQAYSIIEVRDEERKRRLVELGRGSGFIPTAPVILLFVADWARASQMAARAGQGNAATEYFETTVVGVADSALAAQNAAIAASALGLGSCFLGSLRNEPAFMAEEFAVPENAVVLFGLAIGHPDPEERAGIKPRLPQRTVRHRERYEAAAASDIDSYRDTLAEYYRPYNRPHDWISVAVRRVAGVEGLDGRETMREAFAERGLPSR